jgi:3',5'-cyclic AMP phosphodiesterase CpdA
MGFIGRMVRPFAVVNAGDNFYWGGIDHKNRGGNGVHDELWQKNFEKMYNAPALKAPWLSIMGNHDYGGNGCWADLQAQFDYTFKDLHGNNRWKMPGPFYNHVAQVDDVTLEYFMLDTNIEDHMSGRSGGICQQKLCQGKGAVKTISVDDCISFFRKLWRAQLDWFPKALKASTADWKIVVMHHKPHGDVGYQLMSIAQPNGANFLIASHTHEMSFYESHSPPMLVVGAGGGAQANPGCGGQRHCTAEYGFADVSVSKTELDVKIFNYMGKVGYQGRVCVDGHMCN